MKTLEVIKVFHPFFPGSLVNVAKKTFIPDGFFDRSCHGL
jgi:hypothetical protein